MCGAGCGDGGGAAGALERGKGLEGVEQILGEEHFCRSLRGFVVVSLFLGALVLAEDLLILGEGRKKPSQQLV